MNYYNYKIGVSQAEASSMSSVLSGQLQVKIKEGEQWQYNYKHKTVFYNKADLPNLTQEDVIGNLLHETGHAKYSSDPEKWRLLPTTEKKHGKKLKMLIDLVEDFRMEDKIRADYPYAVDYLPLYGFKTKWYLEQVVKQYENTGTPVPKYIQYLNLIYSYISGEARLYMAKTDPDVEQALQDTQDLCNDYRAYATTDHVNISIQDHVYPKIKKLLDDYDDRQEEVQQQMVETIVMRYAGAGDCDPNENKDPYEDFYPEIKPLIEPTVAKLRKILTDQAFDKFEGRYKTGKKLNQRRMYKPKTGDYRIFQRRVEANKKDYEFSLLVDSSGSMTGYGVHQAIKSMILFAHVLNKLDIPYSIHNFHSTYEMNKTTDQKSSVKAISSVAKRIWDRTYGLIDGGGGTNATGGVIKTSAYMATSERTKKFMFTFTDGSPNDGYTLVQAIKKAESTGIKCFGFGLGYSGVTSYWKDKSITVPNIEDLPAKTVEVIKRAMHK